MQHGNKEMAYVMGSSDAEYACVWPTSPAMLVERMGCFSICIPRGGELYKEISCCCHVTRGEKSMSQSTQPETSRLFRYRSFLEQGNARTTRGLGTGGTKSRKREETATRFLLMNWNKKNYEGPTREMDLCHLDKERRGTMYNIKFPTKSTPALAETLPEVYGQRLYTSEQRWEGINAQAYQLVASARLVGRRLGKFTGGLK